MPMKDIHLQTGHFIQQQKNNILSLKRTGLIQHERSPRESRIVFYTDFRNFQSFFMLHNQLT